MLLGAVLVLVGGAALYMAARNETPSEFLGQFSARLPKLRLPPTGGTRRTG